MSLDPKRITKKKIKDKDWQDRHAQKMEEIKALRKMQSGFVSVEPKTISQPKEKTDAEYLRESIERHDQRTYMTDDWNKRQALLKSIPKILRDEANLEIGTVSITSNAESDIPGHFRTFSSIDYLTFEEMNTPMKVEWDREKELNSWGYKYGKPHLVIMNPEEFLLFSHPLRPGLISKISIESVKDGIKKGNVFATPFIYVGKNGLATGEHEGRHRAKALMDMGIKKMSVVIFDERQKYDDLKEPRLHTKLVKEY